MRRIVWQSPGCTAHAETSDIFRKYAERHFLYKTALCRNITLDACSYGDECQFYHEGEQPRMPAIKTKNCRYADTDADCPHGARCTFRHPLTEAAEAGEVADFATRTCDLRTWRGRLKLNAASFYAVAIRSTDAGSSSVPGYTTQLSKCGGAVPSNVKQEKAIADATPKAVLQLPPGVDTAGSETSSSSDKSAFLPLVVVRDTQASGVRSIVAGSRIRD